MNAQAHRNGATSFMGVAVAVQDFRQVKENYPEATFAECLELLNYPKIFASAGFATVCGSLPDILEPATCPNHRKFFHSVVFACGLVWGMSKLWNWQPESELDTWIKGGLLVAGGSYLVHLAMDSTTKKSLPLI